MDSAVSAPEIAETGNEVVLPENVGFDDSELQACLKVLSFFEQNPEHLKHRKFKELRVIGSKTFFERTKTLYDGLTREDYTQMKKEQREKQRKAQMRRDADRNLVNSKQMRSDRREALKRLLDPPAQQRLLTNGSTVTISDAQQKEESEPTNGPSESGQSESANGASASSASDPDAEPELHNGRSCYCCKGRFFKLHFFYDNMCAPCAAFNYEKRLQTADLTGRVVVLTGARIKIGFHCAVKLLRAGATVVATTRFPHDAALRFAKEPAFEEWKSRFHVYGLDLRDLRSVEEFVDWVRGRFPHLDILINNAAQSVRKPPAFYAHLMPTELAPMSSLPAPVQEIVVADQPVGIRSQAAMMAAPDAVALPLPVTEDAALAATGGVAVHNRSAAMSQLALVEGDEKHDTEAFPIGRYDVFDQQLDLRRNNSWLLKLDEVPTAEAVETTAINSLAPFILNSKLKPLMIASPFKDRYIVNVSAMEGKFYKHKTAHHPHTNMAKAALNMVTRTSAPDYAQQGIYMTSVDTGWVTDENPYYKAQEWSEKTNFQCPLDEMEGAARVLDPIFDGVKTGNHVFGKFLKDYHETDW